MNEIAKICKILTTFLVVSLFFGEGLSFARISSASIPYGVSSSASIAMTGLFMSNAGNNDDEAEKDSMNTTTPVTVPLIDIGTTTEPNDGGDSSSPTTTETSRALVRALQTSGFAMVRSPLLTKELQARALASASSFLSAPKAASASSSGNQETPPLVEAIDHPTDPKAYSMLDSEEQLEFVTPDHTLQDYVSVLRSIKRQVLRLIALGLGMADPNFFANLHDEDNDTLRLILYHPTHSQETGNRCKEHSDYGTITLLSTDGVSGLELFHEGHWLPVPHVEGALVVNVGSLLSGWTRGSLKATLHRVAGPASPNSRSDPTILWDAVQRPRTSLAFFADPNQDVSESLQATSSKATTDNDNDDEDAATSSTHRLTETLGGLSVAEYIAWRSGGDGAERSGISFTAKESERIDNHTNNNNTS